MRQAGNVGIGTATPNTAYKLDVAGTANATSLCINGDCKTAWPGVSAAPAGTVTYGGIAWQTTDT